MCRVRFLFYTDEITVLSSYHDQAMQVTALDVTTAFASSVDLSFPQAKLRTHSLQTAGAAENLLFVPYGFNWLDNHSKRARRSVYWG